MTSSALVNGCMVIDPGLKNCLPEDPPPPPACGSVNGGSRNPCMSKSADPWGGRSATRSSRARRHLFPPVLTGRSARTTTSDHGPDKGLHLTEIQLARRPNTGRDVALER